MPTMLTHPAVPIAMAFALGREAVSTRLLLAGIAVAILPDLDVVGFRLGISYGNEFGHRGFSHSLLLAFGVALFGALFYRILNSNFHRVLWFLFAAMASHALLDAFTKGGLGVALLWPWSEHRYFAPVKVIEVSPINPARFLSQRGLDVLWSEIQWVWLPLIGIAATFAMTRNVSVRLQTAARG